MLRNSLGFCLVLLSVLTLNAQENKPAKKPWTLLVYLNGHNSLDSYGALDIREMEKVGSTDKVNVVVQWASMNANTKRLLVQKSNSPDKVTSPVVQELAPVDMGNYRNLIEFVRWGVQNYPAEHYFVDVWNHGGGWRVLQDGGLHTNDISWDDRFHSVISTEQLAPAMAEIAKLTGGKLSIYGSDACLMAMAEVAYQMLGNVQVFVGAEETEPGPGWPYDSFLQKWNELTDASPENVGKTLAEQYRLSYQKGSQGDLQVVLSVFALDKMQPLLDALVGVRDFLLGLGGEDRAKVLRASQDTQRFAYNDYADVGDWMRMLVSAGLSQNPGPVAQAVLNSLPEFVIANETTPLYARALGVSIWLPTEAWQYGGYKERYSGLPFQKATSWSKVLDWLAAK